MIGVTNKGLIVHFLSKRDGNGTVGVQKKMVEPLKARPGTTADV